MTNLPDSATAPGTVLVCVSNAADAAVIEKLLASERAQPVRCNTFKEFVTRELVDADAVLLGEEMLDEHSLDLLVGKLKQQPTWSDLPVVLVSAKGPESIILRKAMEGITGLLLLNRPVHLATLVLVFRMALQSRHRQYRLRDLLLERKQRERELCGTNQELKEYAHALTHNVKAPFRAVKNYANFLVEDLADSLQGDTKKFLEGIQKAVDEANRQFTDLEALYRIRSHTVEYEALDMREVLDEIVAVHQTAPDRQIVIADRWPTVRGEQFLLRQTLTELIQNGLKYNQSEIKRVEVDWQETNNRFEIVVSDNGIGIDRQYHEHIFQIFKRLHTEDEYEGTGIGLAIARRAIQIIGGDLQIASALGQGSTFVISLPTAAVKNDGRA